MSVHIPMHVTIHMPMHICALASECRGMRFQILVVDGGKHETNMP